jgi:pimeloyl-ACP methyl ester carboxylesterase
MNQSGASVGAKDQRASREAVQYAALRRGRIAYHEQGDRAAPLAVLAHGFPDFPKTFFPVMNRLSAAGYRCVAPYLRGYSPSTLEGPFHGGQLGDDLAELTEALSPGKRALLVGHDWGAVATYAAVERHAASFSSAVTLAVPHVAAFMRALRGNRAQQLRSAYMAFFMLPLVPERIVPRDDFAFIDALWRRWSPGYTPDRGYMQELKSVLRASMPAPLAHYRALRTTLIPAKSARPAGRIRVPLLHLHGADDGCIAFESGAGQERLFEAAFRSERIEGVGHFLHLEDPDGIARRILEFAGSGVAP